MIVKPRGLHRIAGVPEIEEFSPFDYATRFHVETGNNSLS